MTFEQLDANLDAALVQSMGELLAQIRGDLAQLDQELVQYTATAAGRHSAFLLRVERHRAHLNTLVAALEKESGN